MANVIINDKHLTDVANAIREKNGQTETYKPNEMAAAIIAIPAGGEELPEEAFIITGNCSYRFAYDGWNWFIDEYGNRITTKDISDASFLFYYSKKLTKIPFDINFKDGGCSVKSIFGFCNELVSVPSIDFKHTSYKGSEGLFEGCHKLREIGTIKNLYPDAMNKMFHSCRNLRYIPEFENLNLSRVRNYTNANVSSMFQECYSLRSIPEEFLKQFYGIWTTYLYSVFNSMFYNCFVLDEAKGLNPQTGTITNNAFGNNCSHCHRLKNYMFKTQEDGIPYSVNWKAQTIDFSLQVGYCTDNKAHVLNYNSGITADKEVTDDASYQALKDDPDWFTQDIAYSRYNHDSAVNTINSLPDTSAYLATAGGTNTIKFKGTSGSLTDGGAINTLTEEEIAVAAAKGWTVSLV